MSKYSLGTVKNKLFNSNVVIRPARTDDLSSMTSLLSELFTIETDFSPDIRRQRQGLADLMANAAASILVAVMDNRIVGMCSLQPLISTAEGGTVGMIEDLVVSAAFRRQGIGLALLKNIEQLAQQKNMHRLQLLTNRNNAAALSFYEKFGWHLTHMVAMRKKFG